MYVRLLTHSRALSRHDLNGSADSAILYYADVFKYFSLPQESSPKRSSEKAQQQALKKRTDIEKAILKQSDVSLAEECSPTGTCYVIKDRVKRVEGEIVAHRSMWIKDSQIYFTKMQLEMPERLNWENLHTKDWAVSKLIVPIEYCQMQIAIGFISESMSVETSEKQFVLVIGLGGGLVPSFFSILHHMDLNIETTVVEIDPFMVQLAESYFDYLDQPGVTNTVVQDGVEFLEDSLEGVRRYHAIHLDACYGTDETKTGLYCPINEFLNEKVVKNIYELLDDKGVLSVNTFSLKNTNAHEEEILKVYSSVFPSCYLVPYLKARNMLVCSKRENWTWKEQRALFQKNLDIVIEKFDFQALRILHDY